MKLSFSILTAFFLSSIFNVVLGQDPRETEIKRLENLERESLLKSDSAALFDNIWSSEMIINSPANVVGDVKGTKQLFRKGGLEYLSFERNIERIKFHDDFAIVMGGEVIKPKGSQPNAGKIVHRRFTHVWKYSNNRWSIIARQATITKVE